MSELNYKSSGVDLELYEQAMRKLPALMQSTRRPGVMDLPGGFAGLFRLSEAGSFTDPVLVSGTDGVGTKLKVAIRAERYDTVGIDLVAMCVNDCLCLGAQPLFFLDYIAMGKDNPVLLESLVQGVSTGCREAGAALLGGETAIMPDLYADGDFDMAGFCVGVADRSRLINGRERIQAGDTLIGIASSGIHSNGYSLVRKVVYEHAGLSDHDPVPELGCTVSEALLTPTRIYAAVVRSVLEAAGNDNIAGIAHITGGGAHENLQRIMPDGLTGRLNRESWEIPAVFRWLQNLGNVDEQEMHRVFNMGIGMVFVVRPAATAAAIDAASRSGCSPFILGEVINRNG